MLGHVLLHLEFQITHEGLVLPVHHAVGDGEAEEARPDQGQAKHDQDPSLTPRHHGVSAEGDDAEAAEHDAHQVEEDAQLARPGPPLRVLTRGSGMKTRSGVRRWQVVNIDSLVKWFDYFLEIMQKHCCIYRAGVVSDEVCRRF